MAELSPAMTPSEKVLFAAFCASTRSYVEFGAGGSTFVAASLVKNSIIALDSDATWLDKVVNACVEANTPVRPQVVYADLGPTKEFGYPLNEDKKDAWPLYHEGIWSIPASRQAELYFVDGRFRVACFLQILLHCQPGAVVLFHDYFIRPDYHGIEPFTREIGRVDQLGAFQRADSFNPVAARALLARHRFDYR